MKKIIAISCLVFAATCHATPKEEASAAFKAGDFKTAFQLRVPLAEAGDVDELGNVGNMYAFGQGVEQSYDKAYSYWLKASEKHLGTAMGNIAVLYMTGKGPLQKNEVEAANWYKRAAEHRHWQSMITLSSLYMLGKGVQQDSVSALAWAGLAASNAPNPQAKQLSEEQVRKMAADTTKEDLSKAQELSNQLRSLIDSNVKIYVNQ